MLGRTTPNGDLYLVYLDPVIYGDGSPAATSKQLNLLSSCDLVFPPDRNPFQLVTVF